MNTPPRQLLALLVALYLCQGLPSGISAHALPALLRSWSVPLEYIGLAKLVALPWALKFLWAPALDRGVRRRSVILAMQFSSATLLLLAAWLEPASPNGSFLVGLLCLLALLNLCAAVQDTATDGLAVRMLAPAALGMGNFIQVGAYKLGLIAGGSGLLMLVVAFGWSAAVSLLALALLLCTLPIRMLRELVAPLPPGVGMATGGVRWLIAAYRGFLEQPGARTALLAVLLYKVGDSFGSTMIRPLLVDAGYSLQEVASITLVASLVSLPAALAGGIAYSRLGAVAALVYLGILQALALAGWSWVGAGHASPGVVWSVACVEQAADAMSTVALFAFMMSWCRSGCESGDYTFQACLQAVVAGTAGALSGWFASTLGYPVHFLLAAALGLLALLAMRRVAAAAA